jgi:GNAT superfamily N-acetyltransferase
VHVAALGDQIVGFLSVWAPERFVHHLYVAPSHQGRGIGRMLIEACAELYGLPLSLECELANRGARRFYERLGWVGGEVGSGPDGEWQRMWLYPEIRIEQGRPADAAEIARISVLGWQAAYRGLMPDEFLDRLDPAERRATWERVAEEAGTLVLVARDREDALVGFAAVRASPDADADASTADVGALYVDPERWGQGVGKALLSGAVEGARRLGFAETTLWVLEGNQRARRFYEAFGFRTDGATKVESRWGGFSVVEVRYRLGGAS